MTRLLRFMRSIVRDLRDIAILAFLAPFLYVAVRWTESKKEDTP